LVKSEEICLVKVVWLNPKKETFSVAAEKDLDSFFTASCNYLRKIFFFTESRSDYPFAVCAQAAQTFLFVL